MQKLAETAFTKPVELTGWSLLSFAKKSHSVMPETAYITHKDLPLQDYSIQTKNVLQRLLHIYEYMILKYKIFQSLVHNS